VREGKGQASSSKRHSQYSNTSHFFKSLIVNYSITSKPKQKVFLANIEMQKNQRKCRSGEENTPEGAGIRVALSLGESEILVYGKET
jgi:hypothetical protein